MPFANCAHLFVDYVNSSIDCDNTFIDYTNKSNDCANTLDDWLDTFVDSVDTPNKSSSNLWIPNPSIL
jgi:hypothetical protein